MIYQGQLFSQEFSEEKQKDIDRLNQIIVHSTSHDTVIVNALLNLVSFYYRDYPDSALQRANQAKEIAEQALGSFPSPAVKRSLSISLAEAINYIGNVYKDHGEFERALEFYNESLKISTEIGDEMGITVRLNNIGVIYKNQGELSLALDYYNNSLKLGKKLGYKHEIAESLNNIGVIHLYQGEISIALEYYLKSLEIREELGNKNGIAISLSNIGTVHKHKGEVIAALDFFNKSLKIYEEIDGKLGIASCQANIGSIYLSQGETATALDYFQKGLKIREKMGDKKGVANSLNSIGVIFINRGEEATGLEYLHKGLKIERETGNKQGIANSLRNLGTIYANQRELSNALDNYNKSLKIYQEMGDKQGIANILYYIGATNFVMGIVGQAQNYGEKSLDLARKLGYPANIKRVSELLYKIYCKTHKYKEALTMYELYIQMRDSINNEETQKAAIKHNMQYEYEKQHLADSLETSKELALKDIEISKQQAEAKVERTTKYGLYGGLALVLVIAFVLARSVKQKKKANEEISHQKQEVEISKLHIEQLHKEVTDSIHYAAHIQNAILTSEAYWQRMLANHFILFKPRDIVSGDFYWAYETPTKKTASSAKVSGGKKIWIAADCTGHGVPGGFMSMLGNTFLNEIVIEQGEEDAAEILNKLRDHIIKALASDVGSEEGLEMKDGMDLAVCILHPDKTLEYSGANNPLWVLSEREEVSAAAIVTSNETMNLCLHEIKADKQPIGKYIEMKPFTFHKMQLQKGDQVYTFTDGFPDQFGGHKLKKYMNKRLKKFLFSIADKSMEDQKQLMLEEFEDWRKETEQVDDVCIIGVKI